MSWHRHFSTCSLRSARFPGHLPAERRRLSCATQHCSRGSYCIYDKLTSGVLQIHCCNEICVLHSWRQQTHSRVPGMKTYPSAGAY